MLQERRANTPPAGGNFICLQCETPHDGEVAEMFRDVQLFVDLGLVLRRYLVFAQKTLTFGAFIRDAG